MPWDNSLNKDADDDILLHVLLTDKLKKGADGKYPAAKYSLETPKLGAEAYRRRIDPKLLPLGSPKPSRILQDVKKALDAMEMVHEYGGAMCNWLANQNGHRRTLKGNWGGPRVKAAAAVLISEMEERLANVDPKVKDVVEDELEKVKERCEKATSNFPEGDFEEEEESTSAA